MSSYNRCRGLACACWIALQVALVGSSAAAPAAVRVAAIRGLAAYTNADLAGDWTLGSFWQGTGFRDQGCRRGSGPLAGVFPYTADSRFGGTVSQTYDLASTISSQGTVSLSGLGDGSQELSMNAGKDVLIGVGRTHNDFSVMSLVRRGSNYAQVDLDGTWHVASYWVQRDLQYVGYRRLSGSLRGVFRGYQQTSAGNTGSISVPVAASIDAAGKVAIDAEGQPQEMFLNAGKDVAISASSADANEFNFTCAVKQGPAYSSADLKGTWHAASFWVGRHLDYVGYTRVSGPFGGTATYTEESSSTGLESGTARLAATINSTGKVTLTGSDTPHHSGQMSAGKSVIAMVNALEGDYNLILWVKEAVPPVAPVVHTATVAQVTPAGALCGGEVTADGGAPVTARGVCWSTAPYPTTADSSTVDGDGTGPFASALAELAPGVTYHVRAYATNAAATAYGEDRAFTTLTPLPSATATGQDLWDLTGTYTATVDATPPLPLQLRLLHDPSGRLSGTADLEVPTGLAPLRVTVPIRGGVRGAAGMWVAYLALQGTDPSGRARVALTLRLTLGAAARTLTGTIRGSFRAEAATTPVAESLTLDIPAPMDGTWTLQLDLARSIRAVSGTATLTLANGVRYLYTVVGTPSGQRVRVSLAGDPTDPLARAITFRAWATPQPGGLAVLDTGLCRGYGQTVTW